jgi:parallel beta-helix repeat protein
MKERNMKKRFLIPVFLIGAFLLCIPSGLFAQDQQVIVVTSAADSGPGTLRDALEGAGQGTVIRFSPKVFPQNNPTEIRLLSELPMLTADNMTIDGSDAGVILVGENGYDGMSGLKIRSSNNTIMGIEIIGFPDFGILIEAPGSNNTIGGVARGEGNTIGWMNRNGIAIFGNDNIVINNHVGIDRAGKSHLSNNEFGIFIADGATGNRIGGEFGVEGNIISGNGEGGILINNGSSGTVIQGNIIGLDAAMKVNIGNSGSGIRIENSTDTLIGGEDEGLGNIICGNANDGIMIQGPESSGNRVINNIIGMSGFRANEDQGVMIELGAHDNQIGPDNVISYNWTNGITITGAETVRNTVTANRIFNNAGNGIYLEDGANGALPSPRITQVSSRRVQGVAAPGQMIEIYSDWEEEARFFECATVANQDGEFVCTLPQGAFQERMLKALATAEDGNSSMLSDAIENPALVMMQELPDIIAPSQVSTDPAVIGTNLSLAVISLVFFGFTTTVFNDLVKESDLRIIPGNLIPRKLKDWLSTLEPITQSEASRKKWRFILFWVVIVLLNALIESFLAPNSRLMDAQRLRIILSLFLTGLLVNSIEWISDWLVRRRLLKEVKLIAQVRWVGLLAAMASVIFSRLVSFTPGYILGTFGTIFLLPDLTDGDKNGKRSTVILTALFACGALFWILSHFLAGFAPWIEPLFLNIFTISVQGVLFELLPLSVCEGRNIWNWNKVLWFTLFGVSVFTFLHTFLNPDAPDLQALQQNGVQVLLVAMAAYGLATLILWVKSKQTKKNPAKEQA